MNIVHIRPVQLNAFIYILYSPLHQFFTGTNTLIIAAVASPDIEGSSPISGPGYGPVVEVFQPVSEPLFSYIVGNPYLPMKSNGVR
jgi:hypothetical protein